MTRIIFHTGTPKTGTSSFQRFLAANVQPLTDRGLAPVRAGSGGGGAHQQLVRALLGRMSDAKSELIRSDFWQEVESAPQQDFIVSAESFAGHVRADRAAPQRFQAVVERARQAGHEIHFLVLLRHTPSILESSYSQQAKSFRAQVDFATRVDQACAKPSYFRIHVETLKRFGLPVILLPFNSEIRRHGIERTIVERLGYSFDGLVPAEPANERAGICLVGASLALTQRLLANQGISSPLAKQMARITAEEAAEIMPHDPSYRPMAPEPARAVEEVYAVEADQIAQTHWGRSWEETFDGEIGNQRRAVTLQDNDDPKRYLAAARQIVAAALPRLQDALEQPPARQWSNALVYPPRVRLAGIDFL